MSILFVPVTATNMPYWVRRVADAINQLIGAVGAVSAGGVTDGDYGDIVVSGTSTVFSFDSSVVTAFARTFLDDASAGDVRSTIGAAATSHSHAQSDLTGLTTADSPQFTGINLGHASDTTLTRVSAGVVAVEGVTLLTTATGQPLDATLTSLAAYNTNGLIAQTAADTFAGRTLTGPAAGITVSNGNGVSGNPTIALANDLSALEGLGSTGIATRTAADTWTQRTIVQGNGITVANGDGVAGNPTIAVTGWALAASWTWSTNVPNVDFTGLAGASDILVIIRAVTTSASVNRSVFLSVDNGSSFYNASGDYVAVTNAGVEANVASAGTHDTATTAARTLFTYIYGANVNGVPKHCHSNATAATEHRLFVASTSPVNAVRVAPSSGNFTAGSIYVLTR